jgi:hypothetical protein
MEKTHHCFVSCFTVMLAVVVLAPSSNAQQPEQLPQQIMVDEDDDVRAAARKDIIPELVAGHFRLPPMQAPTIATGDIGNGRTPDGFRRGAQTPTESLPESPLQRGEEWELTVCSWAAPNTFSNPRYFEDRMVERHGHLQLGPLQPFASGARFFATFPMLPYLMTVRNPCECEYTLGYYRPGSCAPVMLQRPPLDRRAVIVESAAIAGAVIAFP